MRARLALLPYITVWVYFAATFVQSNGKLWIDSWNARWELLFVPPLGAAKSGVRSALFENPGPPGEFSKGAGFAPRSKTFSPSSAIIRDDGRKNMPPYKEGGIYEIHRQTDSL